MSTERLVGPDKNPESPFNLDKINAQLRHWREKLLDLSRSNPLLTIKRSRTARLSVVSPDAKALFTKVVVETGKLKAPYVRRVTKAKDSQLTTLDTLQEVEAAGYEYKLEPGDFKFEEMTPPEIRRRLNRIYDNARTTIEERGLITLYLTLGAIHWSDDYYGESVSPLILVPCEFIYKGPNAALTLQMADDDVQLNPTIEYFLREKHKIKLPALAPDLDEAGVETFFRQVNDAIRGRGWRVTEEVWLGTFNFESMVLFNDLGALADRALNNPVIAALSRASDQVLKNETLGDNLDELEVPEAIPIPVADTDSSQLKALTYAAMNQNIVIHGPPGTGKSQTITNIIADALGRHKKILFVSAKIAALNVVHERLKKIGLGDYCLEAHSTKAGKHKIAEELKRTLESSYSAQYESVETELEILRATRHQLNEYAEKIYSKIAPFGMSPYEAIGRYFRLGGEVAPKFPIPWGNAKEVTRQQFQAVLNALEGLSQMAELYDCRNTHPLRGLSATQISVAEGEEIESVLSSTVKYFQIYLGELSKLGTIIQNAQDFSYEQLLVLVPVLEKISKLDQLPEDWRSLEPNELTERAVFLRQCVTQLEGLAKLKTEYKQYSATNPADLVEKLKRIEDFKGLISRCTIGYWKWAANVRSELSKSVKVNYRLFETVNTLAKKLVAIEDWLAKNHEVLVMSIGEKNSGVPEEVLKVELRTIVAVELRKTLSSLGKQPAGGSCLISQKMSNAAAALVSHATTQAKDVRSYVTRIDSKWPGGYCGQTGAAQSKMVDVVRRCEEVTSNFGSRQTWLQLQRQLARCNEYGLSPMLLALADVTAKKYPTFFEKRFLQLWIDGISLGIDVFAEFSSLRQHELITKLRLLDERIRELNLKKTIVDASEAIRRIQSSQVDAGSSGQVGVLRFEIQKKKRIKPLRKLFAEIPQVLQAIKPCMLMSPISVSTYLHPDKFHFDLVIFDEASQLPPAEAIPAILRASQVVVAGDSKQLPPTSFFDASIVEEDEYSEVDEDRVDSLESLLDNCVAVVPAFQQALLKWHYRSRDERLISFSNHYFYNNSLITFPSDRTDKEGRGVRLEYLPDGVWDRGKSRTNRKEARRVAQLVVEHFDKFPERSLGVVALNSYQKEAIEDALSDELLHREDLAHFFETEKKEPFFVKSLENVQGDERDAMIISVAYAKDPNGALSYNFGPLNRQGGWRRLNVLVTRAKWQLTLVTSLKASDLDGVNPDSQGPVSLRNFIEYAERGGQLPVAAATLVGAETNDFEDSVCEVIRSRGYHVDQQVGAGHFRLDLAIRDPRNENRYLLGIECDGATYHSSRTARDRDLLREEVLQNMGWRLYRVWSTDWFWNYDQAVSDLMNAIKRAETSMVEPKIVAPPEAIMETSVKVKPKMVETTTSRKYSGGKPYEKYNRWHSRDDVMDQANIYSLEEIVSSIVKVEGPIHEELLFERIREACGVARIGSNITNNIKRAISRVKREGNILVKGSFLYWKEICADGFRLSSDIVKRPLRLIAKEELANAALFMIEDQFGMMKDQLPQRVARQFEVARLSPEDSDLIRDVIDDLVESGRTALSGNHITLSGN